MTIDPGFDPERVVTLRLNLPTAKYPARDSWTVFHRELLRRVSALAAVESVALNSAVPLEGGGAEAPIIKEGDPMPSADHPAPATLFQTTSPGYFRTMGIAMLTGRDFVARDTASAPLVAIVDESVVQKVFHGEDPIGKRIAFELGLHSGAAQPIWREVVGVVRHVRHYGLVGEPPYVQVYTPFEQLPQYMEQRRPSMALLVRTPSTPDLLAASLRGELAAIDRDIPVYQLQTMERYLDQNTEQPRLSAMLLTLFGGDVTTSRLRAERAVSELTRYFPMSPRWTANAPLPGGEFSWERFDWEVMAVRERWPFLSEAQAQRLFGAYGKRVTDILGDAKSRGDLGRHFGPELTEAEVRYLMKKEWARFPDDVLWRRSKLGLTMPPEDRDALVAFMAEETAKGIAA